MSNFGMLGNTARDVLLKHQLDKEIIDRQEADAAIITDVKKRFGCKLVASMIPGGSSVKIELDNALDEPLSEVDIPIGGGGASVILKKADLDLPNKCIIFYSQNPLTLEYMEEFRCNISALINDYIYKINLKQDKLTVNEPGATQPLTSIKIDGVNYKIVGGSEPAVNDVKVDGESVVTDGVANIDLTHKVDTLIASSKGNARVFNEESGGGAKFENKDGVESGITVHDGSALGEVEGLRAQIYADKQVDGKYIGSRLNIFQDKITYQNRNTYPDSKLNDSDLEIAVKKDINSKQDKLPDTTQTDVYLHINNSGVMDWAHVEHGSAEWGHISGTITDQQDLQQEFTTKADKVINGPLGKAEIINEADGGGSKFTTNTGIKSYVGVHDGSDTGFYVTSYVYNENTRDYKAIKIDTEGAYYLKEQGKPKEPGDEIATKKDIIPFTHIEKHSEYLYKFDYDVLDEKIAREWIDKNYHDLSLGGCSSVRKDKYYGRSFDWFYDYTINTVVKVTRGPNRFASIGVSGAIKDITLDSIKKENFGDDVYKALPFLVVDGINEKGVFVNVNVTPQDGIETEVVEPTGEVKDEINLKMLPRYVLDHFSTANEALTYIQEHVRLIGNKKLQNSEYEVHFMIGDAIETYILEFNKDGEGKSILNIKECERPILTNFRVNDTTFNPDWSVYTPETQDETHDAVITNNIQLHGAGLERWNLINSRYDDIDSLIKMKEVVKGLDYRKAYSTYPEKSNPYWYTEFTGNYGINLDFRVNTKYDDPVVNTVVNAAGVAFTNRNRSQGDEGTWHTVHSSVYDLEKKILYICDSSEDGEEHIFRLNDEIIVDSVWEKGIGASSAQLIAADAPEYQSKAIGDYTTAEGIVTHANGRGSHTEGENTNTIADYSHAEGSGTTTNGEASHAEGKDTVTNNFAEHAEGKFNISHADSDSPGGNGTISSIGIGEYSLAMDRKKNAFEVLKDGKTYLINVGDFDGTNPFETGVKSIQEVISNKVDKIEGKGLSTNDLTNELKAGYDAAVVASHTHANKDLLDAITASYTTEEKTKLSGISEGANKVTDNHTITNGTILIDGTSTIVYDDADVRGLIAGKNTAYVIDSKSDIVGTEITKGFKNVTAIGTIDLTKLKIGDNVFIKENDAPDYWVSNTEGTDGICLLELETKLDLSNYYTKDDVNGLLLPINTSITNLETNKQDKLTVNPATTTSTLTGLTINGISYKVEGEPEEYLKTALIDNNKLVITNKAGDIIEFETKITSEDVFYNN